MIPEFGKMYKIYDENIDKQVCALLGIKPSKKKSGIGILF